MANKFIVFVVLAAAGQASLAAPDLSNAKEISRTELRQMGETICKAVRNQSWSITDAETEYEKHRKAGEKAFFEAAQAADYQKLLAPASSEYVANQLALFNSLKEAWKCENYVATKEAIRKYQNSLQYAKFVTVWHAVTKLDYFSPAPAVNALKKVYTTLFNEIQNLATSVCGGGVTLRKKKGGFTLRKKKGGVTLREKKGGFTLRGKKGGFTVREKKEELLVP